MSTFNKFMSIAHEMFSECLHGMGQEEKGKGSMSEVAFVVYS